MDSGTTTTSLESVLSPVVLRSTKKIKATTSSAEFAVLVFTSQLYSSQTFSYRETTPGSGPAGIEPGTSRFQVGYAYHLVTLPPSVPSNRPFSKMAATDLNELKLN